MIDDLGYHAKEDEQILAMPKAVYGWRLFRLHLMTKQRNQQAFQQGRDILIHMPMETVSKMKIEDGGLHLGMSQGK